ncbi:BatA domain-containing protein [Haloferula chungangensis]|uniref:BatA domain-containing protein n=1 Tax=Haloferula chungangensis TaxID=1048331 RepID=A0ABW2L4U2_9BACT
MITLANPLGLWALLGIPAVLAIHFLQRQAVVLPITTLFLLEKTQRESASGRRFDRLMNSVPLWMQLLAVLLLTWLLAEPRYQKARSTQRVAIVLDSSASMSVIKDQVKERLIEALPDLQGPASALELTVLQSAPGRERIYTGSSIEELALAFDAWSPRDGLTDPSQAIRLARSIVAREGIVVYFTDTPPDALPFDAQLVSLGEKIENVGITGLNFENKEGALVWSAIVRNYSQQKATRSWRLEFPDGTSSEPQSFDIDPGSLISLQAAYPDQTERARLVLSEDKFALDDVFPMVAPRPKALSLHAATTPEFSKLSDRMISSLDAITPSNDAATADLSLIAYDALDPMLPDGNAVVFVQDSTSAGSYLKGGIVAEEHPLVNGLNWQALLVRETIQLERLASDDVLLWQDARPLIFLRQLAAGPGEPVKLQLCFNFDLRLSNAASQPAFIVCLHRFIESIRDSKISGFSENLETGQPIQLAALTDTGDIPAAVITAAQFDVSGKAIGQMDYPATPLLRFPAPLEPGFLKVTQGETELLDASLHFGDTREADFTHCASLDTLDTSTAEAVERHTVEDHWWRAWVLLLIAALIVSWRFSKERGAALTPQAHAP